jgi:hypothetical protein
MKRCPNCQSIYTDDSLSYCLQDGSKLLTVSDSAASDEVTWQISGERTAREEPPPTEILRPADMPTARMEQSVPTREQQRARATALDQHQPTATGGSAASVATPPAPRSNAAVVALSVMVAILLLALGGLITWLMIRDKAQTGASTTTTTTSDSNQGNTRQANTTKRGNANTGSSQNTAPSPVDVAAAQKEVEALLNAWADSIRQRNLDEHMKYYAEVLDVYYNLKQVSRDRVRTDRAAAFSKYTSMGMELANIKISVDPSGARATATFDKTFDFRSEEKNFNGSGLNRFSFVKAGASWRITGEQDLKTYYTNQ